MLAYNSPREINSDRVGIYALNLTPLGAFEAQEDPLTPLLKSGRYVTAHLVSDDATIRTPLAAVWAGGAYYLLRQMSADVAVQSVQCVRLGADGAVDTDYGVNGLWEVASPFPIQSCAMFWTGNDRLVFAVSERSTGITLYLHDAAGLPVGTFGIAGAAAVRDTDDDRYPHSSADRVRRRARVQPRDGYGTTQGGALQLRQQRIDAAGAGVGAPANLGARAASRGMTGSSSSTARTGRSRSTIASTAP